MLGRSNSIAKDPNRLLELNRPRLKKIFSRLHPSKDGRINFIDVTRFCRQSHLNPVTPTQDLLSTLDLRVMLERLRPNYPTSSITLSFLQFEQLLGRIAQTLRNVHAEERIRTMLEHVEMHCGRYYEVGFVYSEKESPTTTPFRKNDGKRSYNKQIRERKEAESPLISTWSPFKYSQVPKGPETNPQLRRSIQLIRTSGVSRHRSLSKEADVSKISDETRLSEGLASRLSLPSPDTSYLRSITETFESFRARHESLSDRLQPSKPILTQIRRYQDFIAHVRATSFSQNLTKRLILQIWRLEVMKSRRK